MIEYLLIIHYQIFDEYNTPFNENTLLQPKLSY